MYCFKCGARLQDSANFCQSCGTNVGPTPASAAPALEQPPPLPRTAAASPQDRPRNDDARYAGFWRRAGANLLDSLILGVVGAILGVLLVGDDPDAIAGTMYLVTWLGGWLYFALCHSSGAQASPGKRALGIKVTTLDGRRIGFGRATGRYFAMILSGLILGIGYLMAGFTQRRQALHDMIAGTLVVSRETSPEDVAAGLGAPRLSGGALAVALLVALVPVSGILAAIAIPAYQDYLVRSQVAEGLASAAGYKAAVAEALYAGTDASEIDNDLVRLPVEPEGKYVATIEVAGGAIQITYGGESNTRISGQTVTLVPGLSESGDVVWTCGRAEVQPGATALLDDHEDYTSVEGKYLPSGCR